MNNSVRIHSQHIAAWGSTYRRRACTQGTYIGQYTSLCDRRSASCWNQAARYERERNVDDCMNLRRARLKQRRGRPRQRESARCRVVFAFLLIAHHPVSAVHGMGRARNTKGSVHGTERGAGGLPSRRRLRIYATLRFAAQPRSEIVLVTSCRVSSCIEGEG